MKEIELPFDFNAFDSDLEEYRISIPKGFEAEINKDNVVLKKVKNEDDKIKQKIIKLIKMLREVGDFALHKWEADEMLAWLEKQVQKSQGKLELEEIKEEKVDNINKVEQKFKVGDWITNGHCTCQITFIDSRYWCSETRVLGDITSINKTFYLWSINNARAGDVLISQYNKPFIYNGNYDSFNVGSYCGISVEDRFNIATEKCRWTKNVNIHPATKEQCDFLFKKMKEAWYE